MNAIRSVFFWPVDLAHLVFHVATIVLICTHWSSIPQATASLALSVGLVAALLFGCWVGRRLSFQRAAVVRLIYTFVCIPLVFTQLGSLVPYVNDRVWEHRLFAFDESLFAGHNPLEALEAVSHPLLTEFLQWVYDFYYFIPIFLGVAMVKKGRTIDLARMLFAAVVCVNLSYLGYYLLPATGPNIDKFGLYDFQTELPGLFLTFELRETLSVVEKIKQDCFPSGHTAVSLLTLMLGYRFCRSAVPVLWPLVVALIFSTMYLRYHYVADVISGIVLAVVSYHASLWYQSRFERRAGWGEPS